MKVDVKLILLDKNLKKIKIQTTTITKLILDNEQFDKIIKDIKKIF